MKHAIIAIEDRRFYTNEGVDLRGIGRALYQDIVQQKVRAGRLDDHAAVRQERARRPGRPHAVPEAARGRAGLPPHAQVVEGADPPQLPEHDLLRQRRLRHRGGRAHLLPALPPGLRRARRPAVRLPARAARGGAAGRHGRLAERLRPDRPSRRRARAPQSRAAAHARAGLLTHAAVRGRAWTSELPVRGDLQPPEEDTDYPYFTSWIKQQVVDQLGGGQEGARQAFEGGLRDPDDDRRRAAGRRRAGDQRSGCRTAMARARRSSRSRTTPARSGRWSAATTTTTLPFNLATQGQRQPGSAIKPFILAEALRQGISPTSMWARGRSSSTSRSSKEVFTVNNYEGAYAGITTLGARDDLLRQLGVRPGRHQDRHAQDRAAGRAHGHPHATSRPTAR